ncbi:MAG: zinc ABC transporter substrate-binding protein [Planctomycetaceae bacterium]
MKIRTGSIFLCSIAAIIGCGGNDPENAGPQPAVFDGPRPMRIVATTGMVADIVRQVAGDAAAVTALMGPTVDPHRHKPNREDNQAIENADIVFYSGLNLEGRMADTFARYGRNGKPVYAVTEKLDESQLREPPEFDGHYDPHVWMDVTLWSECVGFVADALAEFDPPNAEPYRANAAAYRAELERLDAYAKETIASIPAEHRTLVTSHDAFGYFGRAYGIEVSAVQGITTEAEAAIADVNALVELIIQRKIPAIFVESSVPPKNIQHVMEACRAGGWDVRLGGELFSDAMGEEGAYEGTYIGMIDHNATMIARALGGNAPERGMNGQLAVRPGRNQTLSKE